MTCIDATRCVDETFNGNVSISTLAIEMPAYGGGVLHTEVKKIISEHGLIMMHRKIIYTLKWVDPSLTTVINGDIVPTMGLVNVNIALKSK